MAATPAVALYQGRPAPPMPKRTPTWEGQGAAPALMPEPSDTRISRVYLDCVHIETECMPAHGQGGRPCEPLPLTLTSTCAPPLVAEVLASLTVAEPGTPAGSGTPVRPHRSSSGSHEAAPLLPGGAGPSTPGLRRRQAQDEAPS